MTARADLLQLLAEWGLTTGKGSRRHVQNIMDAHLWELVATVRREADNRLHRREINAVEHEAMMAATTVMLMTTERMVRL